MLTCSVHSDDQVTQQPKQTPQTSNQSPQKSNQTPQQSNQTPQQSNQTPQQGFLDQTTTLPGATILEPDYPPSILVSWTTLVSPTILAPTEIAQEEIIPLITTIAARKNTITTTAKTKTTAVTDDDFDDNTCSSGTNSEVFFEQVEIFNDEDFDCSNEFNAEDTVEYSSCMEALEACQELTDCIGVTSTNHVIKANIDFIQPNSEIEDVEIVNFLPPAGFDFNHDKFFVKHCFSTRQTDTSEFKELETLDCNAEIVCSDGYRKKNFDCVDIDECKLDHDCTFEGKTFYTENLFGDN